MSTANDLSRMVPGFEFLQTLMKGASNSLPGVQGFGQWVAPTLDPEEIDKRVQELKTVQFWLEQNARLLGATVQALEVQRMTLSTLQTMNLPLADLRDALQARPSAPPPAPAPAPRATPSWAQPPAADEPDDEDEADAGETPAPSATAKPAAAPAAVDPMQWWGALTQQFTEIAAKALKDSAEAAAAAPAKAAASPAAKAVAAATRKPARAPAKAGKATKAQPAARAAARKRTA